MVLNRRATVKDTMNQKKGRDRSRPSLLLSRQSQFEARFGGEAGHDLIRVS
jgi:hypothetical protein